MSVTLSTPPHVPGAEVLDDPTELRRVVEELRRERRQLVTLIRLHQELESLAPPDALLAAATRSLGELFGLDRASVYVAGRDESTVRLVSTFEDPGLQARDIDLMRYPELQLALVSGETVFIPDVHLEPVLAGARHQLRARSVGAIIVVPLHSARGVLGAILLRCDRRSPPLLQRDIRFCENVAAISARALEWATGKPPRPVE